ncbi:nucleoside diphosphate kinase B-like isoform X2 [Belonocnema kinseyi]|uniref:nucleoside diphosphate kinase B-like isoform X2 n=1 Tax=Belonocnema kinseyi TaxID=2817044 RepID=UPI00143D5A0E|nr:nucleoside diphosphate kinase B-like isoform X2 [Belonocnema kinseyi]
MDEFSTQTSKLPFKRFEFSKKFYFFKNASEDKMKQHSIHLKTRPFFKSYIKYMTSGPVILMVWEGRNAIRAARLLIGETFPHNCSPKMIRGEFSLYVRRGIIHGSDSMEAASREIELWFGDESPIPIFRM